MSEGTDQSDKIMPTTGLDPDATLCLKWEDKDTDLLKILIQFACQLKISAIIFFHYYSRLS